MYILGAVCGLLALLVSFLRISISFGVFALAVLLALAGIVFLERAPYERQTERVAASAD
jgi:hypothetical protein